MSDPGLPPSPPPASPPPGVDALVEALEARARQAGSEGAMALVRGMLGTLSETMATIDERLTRLEDRLRRLQQSFSEAVDESGSTQQIVDQIRDAVVASLPPPPAPQPVAPPPAPTPAPTPPPPPVEIPIEAIADIVRRESELLTQRVAALAVGVEATRSLLEQHVADTEASLGRRATEVGRRLAADLGLRSRRGDGRRRDRELGPGGV